MREFQFPDHSAVFAQLGLSVETPVGGSRAIAQRDDLIMQQPPDTHMVGKALECGA